MFARIAAFAAVFVLTVACSTPTEPASTSAPKLTVEVLADLPHDATAFTQGLELRDGVLYEGTGLTGRSEMRAVDPSSGAVEHSAPLPPEFFGEGITIVGDRIWQITWQDGVAIERDRASFAERRRVGYQGEGWGLCFDGRRLVMSDGSATLTFRDPDTFQPTGTVAVHAGDKPVTSLNELECVDGAVYANVWQTDQIVRIDPSSGAVTGTADLSGLLTADEKSSADVLNGIAGVPGTDEFLVTGKLWPRMFRVRFTTG